MKKLWFPAVLLLVLSACVPITQGSSSNTPLKVEGITPVKVAPGATWYISRLYNSSTFGIPDSDLNHALENHSRPPAKGDITRSSLGGFSVVSFRAPEGWKVGLAGVNGYREVTDVSGTYYYFDQGVELVFAVEVPATASGVLNTISAVVQRGDKTVTVPFIVSIEAKK